jgi:hypothetical protein
MKSTIKSLIYSSIISLFFTFGCSKNSNPITGEDNSDIPTASSNALIDSNNFLQDSLFSDEIALNGASAKWDYQNILLPQQTGKLYWTIEIPCNDGINARETMRQALKTWQPYVPFEFAETSAVNAANMVVRFNNSETFEINPVEKSSWWQGGAVILAQSFAPKMSSRGLGFNFQGDILINDLFIDWKGALPRVYRPQQLGGGAWGSHGTLLKVLIHEIGHALGLTHNQSSTKNIMSPDGPSTCEGQIYDGDILSITQLYDPAYHLVYGRNFCDRMIMDAYSKILDRKPTPNELASYRNKMIFNRLPSRHFFDYRNLLENLSGSDENWKRSGSSGPAYVDDLYSSLLNRHATFKELGSWKAFLRSGKKPSAVPVTLINSPEWATSFIRWAYSSQMGGSPDDSTLLADTRSLLFGEKDPFRIIYTYDKSPAYFDRCVPETNSGYIERLYTTLLEAPPDAIEYAFWLTWID